MGTGNGSDLRPFAACSASRRWMRAWAAVVSCCRTWASRTRWAACSARGPWSAMTRVARAALLADALAAPGAPAARSRTSGAARGAEAAAADAPAIGLEAAAATLEAMAARRSVPRCWRSASSNRNSRSRSGDSASRRRARVSSTQAVTAKRAAQARSSAAERSSSARRSATKRVRSPSEADGGAANSSVEFSNTTVMKRQRTGATLQVSEVSTSRRASARNSADCISCKRDTVRANSCASGPSV